MANSIDRERESVADIGLLLLRVTLGLWLCYHGLQKVWGHMDGKPILDLFMGGVAEMGFPFPRFFGWCAILAESVGGLCLALGLGTRIAAAFICFTMAVAIYSMAREGGVNEMAALYLVGTLYFLLAGGGRPSLDWLIARRRAAKTG